MSDILPKVDIAFKKIFGVEENKDLLISLINSIVSKEDQVVEVTLLNPYNPKQFKQDKLSILDIKAKGRDGKRYNIEIQITNEADYDKRALYYWAKLYIEQLKEAEDFGTLEKAIGIHILNFLSVPNAKKYHNVFHIVEKEEGFKYFKDLELHTIELKKFSDPIPNNLSDLMKKIKSSLDIWVAFLTKHKLFDPKHLPASLKKVPLEKALNVIEVMNFTEAERSEYEDHLKWLRIQTGTLKKAYKEGEARGEAKGRLDEKRDFARKQIKRGVAIAIICEDTGLTRLEIEEIKKDMEALK